MRKVKCVYLNEELEGLLFPPYPGDLGQKIFESVSMQAWEQWLSHQTMLINENRINTLDPEGRKYLKEQCESFFFGPGADKPAGYIPVVE